MVFLRSGQTAETGPEQKYINAEDVYRKETREEFKKKNPDLASAREAQKKGWIALSEKQKEKYTKLYEQSVQEFEDNLVLFYGGTKKDIAAAQEIKKIPPKPKHPLNALFIYLNEHRDDYIKKHGLSLTEAVKQLSLQYNDLSDKLKKPYETEARKESEQYEKDLEKWERSYGQKFQEGQKVLKDQHKYHSQGRKKVLSYEQILSAKERRKLVPLGDEETKQVGEGRGRPRKDQAKQGQNNRKSTTSRSPSQNPKAQQEQKDQKVGGRGRPKKP